MERAMINPTETLRALRASDEAQEWADARADESAYDLWRSCPRGDWLLWLATEAGVDRRQITLAACACARLVLDLVPDGEERPRLAIEAAEGWARGEVLIEAVESANADAYAAASAAAAAYANAAAAATAAAASATAATAAYASASASARADMRERTAREVRRVIAWSSVRDGLGGAS